MKRFIFLFIVFISCSVAYAQNNDSIVLRKIYTEALTKGKAYDWLRTLSVDIGGRLSGSKEAERAVEFARKAMVETGADTVWLQEVWVPQWVRGEQETARILNGNNDPLEVPITALGGSVCTPAGGIIAPVVEVYDFDQLKKLGEKNIKGKIVFFNHPFDESEINTFDAYGKAVAYRWAGPSEAARYGAVASVCRSMTNILDDHPHTGAMHYNDSLASVPCCAISSNGAEMLSRMLHSNPQLTFFLKMNCQKLDSVKSYNVIGEIRGSTHPEEIITVGGHLDSWETGHGAMDDGAGVVQAIELLRIYKSLGLRPARTVRAVAFMNEENGLKGGKQYALEAKQKNEIHVAAIESDAGGFTPYGFGMEMSPEKRAKIIAWKDLFLPYLVWNFDGEYGGADITPLHNQLGTPILELAVDSQRYFDYHHAASDTFDKVNKRELLLGAAAMAAMAYLLSAYGL